MGIEEQDQILGRLTRERRESQALLAALNSKLEQAGANLRKAGESLRGFLLPEAASAIEKARQAILSLPTSTEIFDDLRGIEAELERMRRIKASLDSFDS